MDILVLLRMVPDVVEELEITHGRTALQLEGARLILSESDNHALAQALLLKESRGARVTVLALQSPEIEETLSTALARGADRAVRITHGETGLGTRRMASIFAHVIEREPGLKSAELILTGVRTIMDLEGPLAPILARQLGRPHLGLVCRLSLDYSGRAVTALREYPDGVRGEFEVPLPAVLGIQVAERPPRYVHVGQIREAMRAHAIEDVVCPRLDQPPVPSPQVLEMRRPRVSVHAEMLTGSSVTVAGRLRDILVAHGLIQGA